MKNYLNLKNLHLIISISIVFPGAFVYGFHPNLVLKVDTYTIDEHNILKAIMGLYLAFSSLWILGIINSNYWKTATISNMLFMLGLGFGRIISIIFDGIPSTIFILGTVGELVLGFYGMYQLKKRFDNFSKVVKSNTVA
jgi:Domain of unknown function (DUF4345)